MAGLTRQESLPRTMRRHNLSTVKVEEKRLQKLLDFIDSRCQVQRSTLRRQIEDSQQVAENTEDQKHKAALHLLKGYFQLSSGRVPPLGREDDRIMGVLSEPSFLPTVPEVDPDILTAPRSMYDRVTKNLDTSKLPYLAPKKAVVSQPASTYSEDSSTSTPASSPEPWSDRRYNRDLNTKDQSYKHYPPGSPLKRETHIYIEDSKQANRSVTPTKQHDYTERAINNVTRVNTGHAKVNAARYQNGYPHQHHFQNGLANNNSQRPSSHINIVIGNELTPRLADRSGNISRSRSLRSSSRHSKAMSLSTVSLTDLNQTRKQKAADKLRTALKTIRVPR